LPSSYLYQRVQRCGRLPADEPLRV